MAKIDRNLQSSYELINSVRYQMLGYRTTTALATRIAE